MMTDPIADMLTRIRNAQRAQKRFVEIPFSKVKFAIAKILSEQEYLGSVEKSEGIAIVSTSQGIMTALEAKQKGIGGELLCTVY